MAGFIGLKLFAKGQPFKYVSFCTGFNLLTSIFLLPYIIMDLPIFVIAEWVILLVDIHCPRGSS